MPRGQWITQPIIEVRSRVRLARHPHKLLLLSSWRKLLRFRPQALGLLYADFG
jgi:hypothetical protein